MKRTSSYFDEKLGNEIAQMDGLNNIELYPLRSLLATKLAKIAANARKRRVGSIKSCKGYTTKGKGTAPAFPVTAASLPVAAAVHPELT